MYITTERLAEKPTEDILEIINFKPVNAVKV